MSSNTFLFKALAAQFDGGRRAHPPKRNTPAVPVFREREIRRDVPEGVKEGAEQRMKGTEGKQERGVGGGDRERAEWRWSQSSQLLCLVTFLQNMIAARFGVGMVLGFSSPNTKQGGAARFNGSLDVGEQGLTEGSGRSL